MIDDTFSRRALVAAAGMTSLAAAAPESMPIIDTHFHLYDQTRPQGAPFPFTPNNPPFLAKDYRASAVPLGIVGGIKVEASPWVEDNLWVLMQIQDEPIIVGMVGNLDPTKPEFQEYLGRYHKNKLFLGIRYGNVWPSQNIVAAVEQPAFVENMQAFARTGLTFEVANPRFDLVAATVKLLDKVPDLRVVLGHLQALPLPAEASTMRAYVHNLRLLAKRNVFVKVSGLPRFQPPVTGTVEPSLYKPMLDLFWETFGEDRIVYAGRNKGAIETLRAYCDGRSPHAAEKYFWKNSIPAFRWVKRAANQPTVS